MKAIILVSSIFYLIGLTIGNKIDLTTKADTAKTTIETKKVLPDEPSQAIQFDEVAATSAVSDSLKIKNSDQ